MNSAYRCGDQEALVSYLYDESTPGEREAVAAHLAHCPACAEEVEALRSTRTLLAQWRPPATSLGFQITAPAERPEPAVLRPAAWWRQPLPAWAQAAAAVLIFAAGMAAGMGRAAAADPDRAAPAAGNAAPAAATAAVPAAQVTREDLARLEQRLAAAEAAAARVQTRAVVGAAADEDAIVRRIQTMVNQHVEQSEARQRETVALIANIARSFDLQERQVRALGQVHDVTVREVRQQRDALETLSGHLVRASFSPPVSAR